MSKNKVQDELMSHEFDGIKEFDNELPPWWVYMFYITIGFAIVYFSYYHIIGKGLSQTAEYEAAVKEASVLYKNTNPYDNSNWVLLTDQENLKKGSEVFATNCSVCHGPKAAGVVGPNLTDEYWINGAKFVNITTTIIKGVPDKGMLTWEGILKPEEIKAVASYVVSLQGTLPENPKEPQGNKVDPSEVGK